MPERDPLALEALLAELDDFILRLSCDHRDVAPALPRGGRLVSVDMTAAVDRLVAQAVEQGFGEFVSDEIAERCGAIIRPKGSGSSTGRPVLPPWTPPRRAGFRMSWLVAA